MSNPGRYAVVLGTGPATTFHSEDAAARFARSYGLNASHVIDRHTEADDDVRDAVNGALNRRAE